METLTITRTLEFRNNAAWLNVNGRGEKIIGSYDSVLGSGWVADRLAHTSVHLPVDVETWESVVRLVHLYP